MNYPTFFKKASLKAIAMFGVVILILFQTPASVFADPASFFDTDLAQGETRFREVVDEANSSAVYYSYEFTSSLTNPTCIPVPREGGGLPAYVKPTKNGSAISFSQEHVGVHFHNWSVGVSSWADVVNNGVKWEFFSDATCSTPMEVNSFSVYVNDWGTCCNTGNYTPTGTANGTAIYTIFDGGSYGSATELLGNIIETISSTTHIVAEIDDRSDTFTEVTVAPNGDGEAFAMGGKIIFSTVPTDSVPPGSGSTPSIPPEQPDLIAISDLGTSSTDNRTADTTPTFTVQFTPQNDIDFVNLYANGVLIGTSGIAGTTNPTTVTITSTTLTEGTYTITAKVENGYWHDESDPSPALTNVIIDSTPPQPTISSPDVSDGDTTNDPSITLNFSHTESAYNFVVGDIDVSNGTLSSFSGSGTSFSATLTPDADGEVIVEVPRNVYIDLAGNDNLVSNEFNWFSDQTPPTVMYNPKHGETIVANDGNIILTLSEEMRQASDGADLNDTNIDTHITLRYDDAGGALIPFDATIDLQNMVITVNPDSTLDAGRDIYVSIGDSLEDTGGTALADTYAIFNTAPPGWPTLTSSDPADGDYDVLIDSNITLYFSEAVYAQSGNIELRKYDDNSLVESFDVTGPRVSGDTTSTIVIDPTIDLESLTDYYILIDGSAFDDSESNSYYGISDKDKLDFTTEFIDIYPPVPTFNPADGETDVSVSTSIVITFDEAIRNIDDSEITNANAASLLILKETNASGSDIAFTAVIDPGKQTITITPDSSLTSGQKVYVAVGPVEDADDNAMTTKSSTFTVEDIDPPNLTDTIPADEAAGVAVDQNLIMTFDEPVWTDFGTIKIYNASDHSVFDSISVASTGQFAGIGTNQITVNPSNTFINGDSYYVQIDGTAFVDDSSNRYAGISNTTDWNFTAGSNQAPSAVNDSFSTNEETPITPTGNVTSNDTDPDGGTVTFTGHNDSGTVGLVTSHGNGTFDYDPNGQFDYVSVGHSDTDTFQYTIRDDDSPYGYASATATITISGVNDPVTAVDDAVETDEDTAFTTANLVAANDTDIDQDDTLTVTAIDTTGTVGLVTNNGDGTFDYDPNGAFSAVNYGESTTDTFTYTVSDGNGSTDTAVVTVTITGVNHHPSAVDNSGSTDEETLITTVNVLLNDSDSDGDTIYINDYDESGTTGDVTYNGDGTFDYDPVGFMDYLAQGETAPDSFTYTISDGLDGTDTAAVTITVSGINDPVSAAADSGSTDEDTSITTVNVLTNDSDPDTNDTLSVVSMNVTSTTGLVTNNGNGTFNYDPNGQFDGLNPGESTTDTFEYTVGDGNGSTDTETVTITVAGLNDDPDAVDDGYSTDEDTAITTGNAMSNDSDADVGSSFSITSYDDTGVVGLLSDNGNGTFDYDPNGQFENLADGDSAAETFTYTITDDRGAADTATVTITINGVNDGPDAVDDTDTTFEDVPVTIDVLANDTDGDDGTTLFVDSVTQGTSGTVVNNGTDVTYTPNANYFGSDTFTYTISDGDGGSDTASVTVAVDPVEDVFVFGNTQQIFNGDTTPSTLDDTDFGITTIYTGIVDHVFTIENPGTVDVLLNAIPRVDVAGANPEDFTVVVDPDFTILANGGTTTFTVRFTPTDVGTREAVISFINNIDTAAEPFTFAVQGEADATGDQDGDGMDDELEGSGDRDGDGVQDYADYDPTGYFYNEENANIVDGGLVEVTGPGVITMVENGSSGYYQFYTDGTAGTYTLSVTLPGGYQSSKECVALDPPPFDPTGNPDNPVMLGNGEDGTSGRLTSNECTDFYLTFDLEAGDPFIINNNFALSAIPEELPDTGFAPGQMTVLAPQPTEKAYEASGMRLEIPTIGVNAPIVGVPTVDGKWDVTWLGDDTGYLIGTAYPTWDGNTVITGHVWNQFNQPSVFAYLRHLQPGDIIKIHAWGMVYTYKIEESGIYWPKEFHMVSEELEGDWLTLFTCENYNSALGEYLNRRVVRALQVSVDTE